MADHPDEDPGADTGVFQAFMDADSDESTTYSRTFRVVSLLIALALFIGSVFLLFQ